MDMKKNTHIGSNFDDFLKEEGILEEIEEVVAKKILFFKWKKKWKNRESIKQNLPNGWKQADLPLIVF